VSVQVDLHVSRKSWAKRLAYQTSKKATHRVAFFIIDTYAWALVKSGLPQVAEPLFAKATELAPNIAVFHDHRAIGFKQLGRLEDAKKALMLAQAKVSAQDPLRQAIESELASL
jgi:Flp pilus assembly protein TadD